MGGTCHAGGVSPGIKGTLPIEPRPNGEPAPPSTLPRDIWRQEATVKPNRARSPLTCATMSRVRTGPGIRSRHRRPHYLVDMPATLGLVDPEHLFQYVLRSSTIAHDQFSCEKRIPRHFQQENWSFHVRIMPDDI